VSISPPSVTSAEIIALLRRVKTFLQLPALSQFQTLLNLWMSIETLSVCSIIKILSDDRWIVKHLF